MKERKKSILMISAQYLPESFGGAIQQSLKLSKQLVLDGFDVSVLTSRNSFSIKAYEEMGGVKIYRLWTGAPPQYLGKYFLSSLLWLISCFFWFSSRRNKYDIIHIHQAKYQAFVGGLMGRFFKKPTLAKVGSADFDFDLESLKRRKLFGKYIYNSVKTNINKFVAISSQIEQDFKNHNVNSDKVVKIPNGVVQLLSYQDITYLKEKNRKELLSDCADETTTLFLSAGRLSEEKNLSMLLHSFAVILTDCPNAKLVILGNGTLYTSLKSQTVQLGIDKHVVFKGYVKNVQDYMIACDFFVLPSLIEGMSNSLLEAMSVGLTPIATAISGSEDLVSNGNNGFLVEEPRLANLQIALKSAYSLPQIKRGEMQQECFNTIKNGYKMEVISRSYQKLYQQLGL